MVPSSETQQEIDFLMERIQQLRALQANRRNLRALTLQLQSHIDKLQARLSQLARKKAS